jgi:hypothetical protein
MTPYTETALEDYVALTSTLGGGRPAMSPLVSSLQYDFIINIYGPQMTN